MIHSLRPTRLSATLNALTIGLVVWTTLLLGGFSGFEASREARAHLQQQGLMLAEISARNAQFAIYTQSAADLTRLVDALLEDEDVIYAAVRDEHGGLLKLRASSTAGTPTIPAIGEFALADRSSALLDDEDWVHVAATVVLEPSVDDSIFAPVQPAQATLVGFVQIGLADVRAGARMRGYVLSLASAMALIALLAAFLTFAATRRITRPVTALIEAAREVSRGNLGARVPGETRDEIGALVRHFNSMVGELESSTARLQSQQDELERRVRERTEQLEHLARAAQEASEAKSRFLANMSHEIRTPMHGVLGMAESLLETQLDPGQRRSLQAISDSGEALLHVLNDVLDFSKIESGQLELGSEELELHRLLEGIAELFGPRAAQKNLALTVAIEPGVPARVDGDPVRLRQIVTNLVGNAIKFTDHGEVAIEASARPADDERIWVRIAVRDTGIGITDDQSQRLFQLFSQVDDSLTRRFGGTGLGLLISRNLARLMGGDVEFDSEPGHGSTFWLDVPLKTLASAPSPSRARTDRIVASDFTGLRVLVVEDSEVNWRVARARLESLGCAVEHAGDGEVALERLGSERFDLVFMDCQMPRMDGYAATMAWRQRESGGAHLPIVALTAHALPGERERCEAAGMDDFLAKPFNRAQIAAVLERWLPEIAKGRASD